MSSLAKPKYKTSLPEKQNTWGNLLNKKTSSNSDTIAFKTKYKKNAPITDICPKKISKSVQCDSSITKLCQSSNSQSALNPIRTLQFLIKEMNELPNVQNMGITQIINEMQNIVEKIIIDYSGNAPYLKLNMPVIYDESMIPTKDNDYYKDLKYGHDLKENKYFVLLLEKISELENKYGQLTKNYTLSEEKLQCITSERDKLLETFKESCSSIEKFNNREREYLDTISELKSRLIASEKLISKQETVITNLNKRLNNLSNKNQVEFANENVSSGSYNVHRAVLEEKNELKKNYNITESNLDKSNITNNFQDNKVSKPRSDIKQIKPTMLSGLKNIDNKSISMTPLKTKTNLKKDFLKCNEDNGNCIDIQYAEHHLQASAIKQAKIELRQLFATIKTKTDISKKLFHSTIIDKEINLSDISDEEDNQSNVSNFLSIVTDSSC